MTTHKISIAIPTFDRGRILSDTIRALLHQNDGAEIVVVDQTLTYSEDIARYLRTCDEEGKIRWLRLDEPSIPHAMNVGLREATGDIVLFLDDDIVPGENLVGNHLANYAEEDVVAVAGQVIQPWQSPVEIPRPRYKAGIWEDLDFPFHSMTRAYVRNCMAGNLSVRREAALAAGGFDENFVGAAYRFETEFCRRLTRQHGKIVFDPKASIRHLKAESGGIRTHDDGVRGSRIEDNVGDYYFAFLEASGLELFHYSMHAVISTTLSKYHARHPWMIPNHILCQIASIKMARGLYRVKRAAHMWRGGEN